MTFTRARPADLAASLSIPIVLLLSLAALATVQDGAAAAETSYLALLAAAVLLPVAVLTVKPVFDLALPTLLLATLAWAVPAGPTRGGAVVVLLGLTLALNIGRRLVVNRGTVDRRFVLPTVLALGFLFRADELLHPDLGLITVVRLLGLPLATALGVLILAQRHRPGPVLLATAAAVTSTSGWSTETALAMLAFAGVTLLGDRSLPAFARAAALLLPLAAAMLRDPRVGAILLAAILASYLRNRPVGLLVVATAALVAASAWPDARAWTVSFSELAWLPLLLPLAFVHPRHSWRVLTIAAVLGVSALRLLPPELALPPVIALAALHVTWKPPHLALQGVWSGALLTGTVVLASYPWFREATVGVVLERLSLGPHWISALALVLVLAVVGSARRFLEQSPRRRGVSLVLCGLALLWLGALAALPPRTILLIDQDTITLDARQHSREVQIPTQLLVREVIVDSYLAASIDLPAGTPIATVTLADTDGSHETWTLEAHQDSGDWAAGRPEVATRPGLSSPPPWMSWVAPEGFFAQRYRSSYRLRRPRKATTIRLERNPDLPANTLMAVFQVGLR